MKKVNKRKGFTLAELLVVIAILAILVAVAVPVFTSQLDRANETVKEANYRAAESAAMVDYLSNNRSGVQYYEYSVDEDTHELKVEEPKTSGTEGALTNTTGVVKVGG